MGEELEFSKAVTCPRSHSPEMGTPKPESRSRVSTFCICHWDLLLQIKGEKMVIRTRFCLAR